MSTWIKSLFTFGRWREQHLFNSILTAPGYLPRVPVLANIAKRLIIVATVSSPLLLLLSPPAGGEDIDHSHENHGALLSVNDTCPVLPDEIVDPSVTIEYEGETIAFCCERCLKAFRRTPEEYVTSLNGPMASVQNENHDADGGHDHADHGSENSSGFSLLALVGKFHPLLVHFPIALVIVAGLAELLGVLGKLSQAESISRFMLLVGAISAVPVVASGWQLAGASYGDGPVDAVLKSHRWAGVTTGVLIVCSALTAWYIGLSKENRLRRRFYWALLAVSVLAVSITGHLGATLVYGRAYWGFPIPFIE